MPADPSGGLAAALPAQRRALAATLPLALPATVRAALLGALPEPPARTARAEDEPWWKPRPAHDPGFGPPDPTDTRLRGGLALAVALLFGLVGFGGVAAIQSASDDGPRVITAHPVGPLPPGATASH